MNEHTGSIRAIPDGGYGWTMADALLITDDGPALDPEALVHVVETPHFPMCVIRHGNGFEVDRTRCIDHPFRRSARLDLIPVSDVSEMDEDEEDDLDA